MQVWLVNPATMLDLTHFDVNTMLGCLCPFMRYVHGEVFVPWDIFWLLSKFYGCILCVCVMGALGQRLTPPFIALSISFSALSLSLSLSLFVCVSLSVYPCWSKAACRLHQTQHTYLTLPCIITQCNLTPEYIYIFFPLTPYEGQWGPSLPAPPPLKSPIRPLI